MTVPTLRAIVAIIAIYIKGIRPQQKMLQKSTDDENIVSSVILLSPAIIMCPVAASTSRLKSMWRCRREYLVVTLAGIAYTPLATVIAYSSPALPHLQNEFPNFISAEQGSWFSSLGSLGAAVGTLLGGQLANRLGRRNALLYTLLFLTFSWLIVVGSAQRLWLLLVGRTLTGVTSGTLLAIIPTYVAEISSAGHRGTLQSITTLIYQLGYVFTYVVGAFGNWKWLTLACMGHVVVSTVGVPCLPESPRWLLSHGRHADAESTLKWIRQSSDVESEMKEMKASLKSSETEFQLNLQLPKVYKPLLLSFGLMIFLVSTGIDVVLFYTVTIFQEVPPSSASATFDPYLETVVVGTSGIVGVIAVVIFVDNYGRRPILMTSGVLVAIFMGVLGAFFKIRSDNSAATEKLNWVPMVCLVGFLISYNIGWGGVPYALSAEILPTEARALGTGICFTLVWIFGFVWTKCYVAVQSGIGMDGMFWTFSACSALGVLFVYFFIPETKGKSLEQIEAIFNN